MAKSSVVERLTRNRPAQLSRLAFMEIGEEDRALLRELAGIIAPYLDEIIRRWYDFLLTRDETRKLLSSTLVEGHLKRMQVRYFKELLAAVHDERYFEGRMRIGLIHYQVGLAPEWYLGAYRKYWDIVQGVLEERGFEEAKVVAWTRALQKVMYLDLALALDTYFDTAFEALEQAKDTAEAANKAKGEFLAMVTHDLKNPLNSILGFADLMLDEIEGPINEDQRGNLLHIKKSAKHILRLVEDILDFSGVERARSRGQGAMKMQATEFSLRGVIHETIAGLASTAEQKRLRLKASIQDDVPDRIVGDPDRLRQIITNLVGNAIKFTDYGDIQVYAEREIQRVHRADRSCLQFGVRDTGVGIPPEKQSEVFKPFVQLGSQKRGGLGLGLAISLDLIELMDGRIWIDSEVGKGSTFNFTACFGAPRNTSIPYVEVERSNGASQEVNRAH